MSLGELQTIQSQSYLKFIFENDQISALIDKIVQNAEFSSEDTEVLFCSF